MAAVKNGPGQGVEPSPGGGVPSLSSHSSQEPQLEDNQSGSPGEQLLTKDGELGMARDDWAFTLAQAALNLLDLWSCSSGQNAVQLVPA